MPHLDVISWTSIIAAFVESPGEALELLRAMGATGTKANAVTLSKVLSICSELRRLTPGRELHSVAVRNGLDGNSFVVISTALVLVYTRCGELELSRRIFSAIPQKDTVAWNTMIMANSTHGHGEEALALFREMVGSGLRPNSVTFVAALSGCSHSNLVEEGRKVFDSMLNDHGVVPDADHHSCMVDILSRAGLLHEAHEFIQKMSLKPTAGAWGALLAGCRVYKNVELGKTAARRLFEIEPDNPGNYVLLSNIFGPPSCGTMLQRSGRS
ncbi:unnamed protein product [Spirodela intermedia]|uniref:Uncharacterized protein n=1 Tax=Spirodela intermedia TaxID=51605 RepID=A0A7I8IK36_SPIIN|nr:unnamed protein product [Spirodela intermedia]CAA6657730.1 unnamed protein product [Spirodela intermedia]